MACLTRKILTKYTFNQFSIIKLIRNRNRIRNSTLHSKIDSSMNYDESSFNNHDITITSTESLNKSDSF